MNNKQEYWKIIRKVSYILLPVIVTFLLTQSYYQSNIRNQVKTEAEKDLYISQLETYNALCLIKSIDSLKTFYNKAYYGNAKVYVSVDDFGNQIRQQRICDTTNVVLKDSMFFVPNFVCNWVAHDMFMKCIDILESNCMNLEPKACELSCKLISFVNNHPINNHPINNHPINNHPINNHPINNHPINNHPINNTPRKKKDIIESGWVSADIYNEYYKIVDELYQTLKLRGEDFEGI